MIELQTEWGWLAALYLFLGGLGAGMFLVVSLLAQIHRKRHRKTIAVCYWIATSCLLIGLVLLLIELIHPGRALFLWSSFSNFSSWMTLGAWGIAVALLSFICTAFLSTRKTSRLLSIVWNTYPGLHALLRKIFTATGSLLALFVMVYTGVLLMSPSGIPFWDSWLLPCLFSISALGAGIGAVTIVAIFTKSAQKISRHRRRYLATAVIGIVVLEGGILFLYINNMLLGGTSLFEPQQFAAIASADILVFGNFSLPFWGLVVFCGLVLPLVLSSISLILEKHKSWLAICAGAVFTLIGECTLRFLILHTGMSADFVGQTLLSML